MNETGKTRETIPPRLAKLTELVPKEEEIIYWLTANDDFWGYFSYINRETSQSCPPISYLFVCCNLFNLPCIHSDYKNNSQKLLMLTEDSVILAASEEPACCCFAPSINAEISSWSDIKFIGSKQEFAKIQKERNPSSSNSWENAFLTEPLDLLMVARGDESQKALWLDFITYRSLRVDEIKALKAQLKTKKANQRSRLNKKTSLEPVEERQSEVELSQVAIRPSEEKEAI
jgi:hypothetical protein